MRDVGVMGLAVSRLHLFEILNLTVYDTLPVMTLNNTDIQGNLHSQLRFQMSNLPPLQANDEGRVQTLKL